MNPVTEPTLTMLPPPLLQEDAEHRADRPRHVAEVDLVDGIPVLVGHLVQLDRGDERDLPADDRDQDIESAQLLHRAGDHGLDVGRRTDIAGHRVRRAAPLPHGLGGLLGPARVEVRDHHRRPFVAAGLGHRPADSAAATDDQRSFPAQLHARERR